MCWRSWVAPVVAHECLGCSEVAAAPALEVVVAAKIRKPRARQWWEPRTEPEPGMPVRKRRKRQSAWRTSPEGLAWKSAVKGRDGCCLDCGALEGLHAHHVDRSVGLRFDIGNGRTLCAACHRLQHPELPGRLFGVAA